MQNQKQKLDEYRKTMGQLYAKSNHTLVDEQSKIIKNRQLNNDTSAGAKSIAIENVEAR